MASLREARDRIAGYWRQQGARLAEGRPPLVIGYGAAALAFLAVFAITQDVARGVFVFGLAALVALLAVGLGASLSRGAPLLSLAAILGTLGVFATLYRTLAVLDEDSMKGIVDAWDAIYFSFVVGSSAGFGDIVPISAPAKMLVVFELLIVGVLIATTALAFTKRERK